MDGFKKYRIWKEGMENNYLTKTSSYGTLEMPQHMCILELFSPSFLT